MAKIAVYTIALNEEKHVKRWFDSAKEADLLLIADTGSIDKTIVLARSLGIKVHQIKVDPWRFDVARNASLALIPEEFDICIQLDMDEVLPPEWRLKVEQAWDSGNTWPIYRHVTARYPDGTARSYQHYFKIHPRKGFIWKYPIHEVIVPQIGVEHRRELIDLEVDHLQDHTKSRNSYLTLLETAIQEFPGDWRVAHYLNREYWYNRDWHKVIETAYSGLEINSGWDVERASTAMWASDAAVNLGFKKWAMEWAKRATDESPQFYEAWHWRAHVAYLLHDWHECYDSARKILTLERQSHHLVKPEIWEWHGYDLLALGAYNLKRYSEAFEYGTKALQSAPGIQRLRDNLNFYSKALEIRRSDEFATESTNGSGLISLITPTRNRDRELSSQYQRLVQQSHTNWEWLILDDSPEPSKFGISCHDARVKYTHITSEPSMSIGEKRNRLIEAAQGSWIAHIDDDDFYGNEYLASLLNHAVGNDVSLVYLKNWYFLDDDFRVGTYDSDSVLPRIEGWGFTYLYKRDLGRKVKFPENNWEDHFWFQEVIADQRFIGIKDNLGLVLKRVHKSNTSRFPWSLVGSLDFALQAQLIERFGIVNDKS